MARRIKRNWSRRFVSYARVHGRDPDQQIEHDRKQYPGGCMTGYITWVTEMRHKWKLSLSGDAEDVFVRSNLVTDDAQREFDDWLEQQPRGNLY